MMPWSCASVSAEQACTKSFAWKRQRALALEHRPEIVALDVLHDEVEGVLELAEVEGLDDVRVIELAHGLRLEPKALHHLVSRGRVGREHLHRGDLAETQVLDAINDAHPTAADAREHAVAAVDDAIEPPVIDVYAGRLERDAALPAIALAPDDLGRAL
jgi:hypothetical protein